MNLVPAKLIQNLPDSPRAKLPETYQRAKDELARCDRVDECKEWSDKALALAAYARQAKDEQFLAMAVRIQTRAITRAGELLAEEGAKQGARTDLGPRATRSKAATDAGLSDRQRKTALRAATFKRENPDEYERLVEGQKPPTPTKLASMGTHRNPSRTRAEFRAATKYLGLIKSLHQFLTEESSPKGIVAGLGWEHEMKAARDNTHRVLLKMGELKKELDKWKRSEGRSRKSMKK